MAFAAAVGRLTPAGRPRFWTGAGGAGLQGGVPDHGWPGCQYIMRKALARVRANGWDWRVVSEFGRIGSVRARRPARGWAPRRARGLESGMSTDHVEQRADVKVVLF